MVAEVVGWVVGSVACVTQDMQDSCEEAQHLGHPMIPAPAPPSTSPRQVVHEFVTKIIQVFDCKVARHGNMIVGKTGSGKSEAWKCLQRALARLKKDEPDDERYQKVVAMVVVGGWWLVVGGGCAWLWHVRGQCSCCTYLLLFCALYA